MKETERSEKSAPGFEKILTGNNDKYRILLLGEANDRKKSRKRVFNIIRSDRSCEIIR